MIRGTKGDAVRRRKGAVRQTVTDVHHHPTKVDAILLCPVVAPGTSPGAVCRPEHLMLVCCSSPLYQEPPGYTPWALLNTLETLTRDSKPWCIGEADNKAILCIQGVLALWFCAHWIPLGIYAVGPLVLWTAAAYLC